MTTRARNVYVSISYGDLAGNHTCLHQSDTGGAENWKLAEENPLWRMKSQKYLDTGKDLATCPKRFLRRGSRYSTTLRTYWHETGTKLHRQFYLTKEKNGAKKQTELVSSSLNWLHQQTQQHNRESNEQHAILIPANKETLKIVWSRSKKPHKHLTRWTQASKTNKWRSAKSRWRLIKC